MSASLTLVPSHAVWNVSTALNPSPRLFSPGHPDRLADAIAESIVAAAVRQKPDALVGVEVAVHTDCVFIDGRIAAGSQPVDIEQIVRDVYRAAGYGGSWNPDPGKIRVTTDLCQEALSSEESDIRRSPMTRTSSSATPAAMSGPTTFRPLTGFPGNSDAGSLRGCGATRISPRSSDRISRSSPHWEVKRGEIEVEWRSLVLSIQHIPRLPYERQHRILLPLLEQILRDLEAGGLEGAASTFTSDKLLLNAAGEFAIGGPEGDNGLSGKKLVIDHYGPGVPIGGGALSGKDPHKVDKCGVLRARQLAKKLVRGGVDEARVTLGWAPGGDAPFLVEASTTEGNVNLQVPRGELLPEDWFTIKSIARDLELHERDWTADLLAGYFCQASAPWER